MLEEMDLPSCVQDWNLPSDFDDSLSPPAYSSPLLEGLEGSATTDFSSTQWLLPVDQILKLERTTTLQTMCSADLMHKPRGSRGQWVRVDPNERIRVAKEKGKKLKLQIELGLVGTEYNLTAENVSVFLHDQQQNCLEPHPDHFIIDCINWTGSTAEIEVKLFRMHKNMQFVAHIKDQQGAELLRVQTALFSTHNSGAGRFKDIKSDDSVADEKKRRLEFPASSEELSDHVNEDLVTTIPGSLVVNGAVKARAFTQYSDLRLKANIEDIVDALEMVMQLQGKTYTWKDGEEQGEGGKKVIGLIAQEVKQVVPEVVHEEEGSGLLSVSYSELIPVLIEAFKQFVQQYESDQDTMKDQMKEMHARVEQLSKKLEEVDAKTASAPVTQAIEELRGILKECARFAAEFIERESSGIRTVTWDFASYMGSGVASKVKQLKGGAVWPSWPTSLHLPSLYSNSAPNGVS